MSLISFTGIVSDIRDNISTQEYNYMVYYKRKYFHEPKIGGYEGK